MGKINLDNRSPRAQHSASWWTVLCVGSLLMSSERTRTAQTRKEKEEVFAHMLSQHAPLPPGFGVAAVSLGGLAK